jgi:LPS sulfotransferase NodH
VLAAYLDALLRRRSRSGIFATKIQHWQYRQYLDNPKGDAFLDNSHFIYLYRAGLLDQAISLRFAKVTGKWGVDGNVTTRVQDGADVFDLREIDRAIRDIHSEERGWRNYFERRGIKPKILSYEDIQHDPLSAARGLADVLFTKAPLLPSAPMPSQLIETSDSEASRDLRKRVRSAYVASRGDPAKNARWPAGDS